MFGAFRYNETTKNLEHIQLSNDDTVDARGHTLVACDPCRAQKLKCNGDRNTCDRCLSSLSKTCTYTGRKRPGHVSISSKRQRREKHPNSTEPKDLDTAPCDNARRVSASWSDDSAISCGSSPSTLRTATERQPLFIGSDLSWESINELIDTSNINEIETVMSPGIGIFENSLASYPESATTPDSEASLLQMTEESLCEPIWGLSSEFELIDEHPHQANQARPRLTPYREIPSSQFVGKVVHQVYCNCLYTMTQLLEETESTAESQGIDDFMMCLGRGTKMCESVLACIHCNACVDNAILFTSNAQQLVSTAQSVSSKLLLNGVPEIGDDLVIFGRYRIEQPEMKNRLVYQMVLLHIEDLQQLLAKIRKGIGFKRKAEELLVDAESSVAKLSRVIRGLAN